MEFATLREKIAYEKQARNAKHEEFEALLSVAHAKGLEAGRDCRPIPMHVLENNIPIACIDDGACGFAWVAFPGNTSWGKWAKKKGIARSHYPKGLCVWVSEFGQSVDRKSAYAGAFAQVLRNAGIECYASSRLD
jgi:hypothetical protein